MRIISLTLHIDNKYKLQTTTLIKAERWCWNRPMHWCLHRHNKHGRMMGYAPNALICYGRQTRPLFIRNVCSLGAWKTHLWFSTRYPVHASFDVVVFRSGETILYHYAPRSVQMMYCLNAYYCHFFGWAIVMIWLEQ